MRVLVTGASGNIGTALLRRLAAEPDATVVGLARRVPKGRVDFPYDTCEWVACDVADPDCRDALVEACQDATAVVHLAWALQPSHNEPRLIQTNVEGSQHVFDAAVQAGVPQVVYLSSVGAYSPGRKDTPVNESWPTDGVAASSYSRHKSTVERLLDKIESEGHDTRFVRLHPGLVFQRAAASEIARYFLGPFAPLSLLRVAHPPLLPLDERMVFQCVHADDVAEAIVRAIRQRASGAFNIAADPVLTPRDLAELLGARFLPVRGGLLHQAAGLVWRLRLQPTEPGWIDLALAAPVMSTERARRELGWTPRHDAREALRELLDGLAHGTGAGSAVMRPRESVPTRVTGLLRGRLPGTTVFT
ncbi:epimerase [Carbonactinospora thermoautotrophica]|uniref:NAD-dependent epimerase/dehydratase family protein n=1 Tax=Carbonactinospora thermoautotrophica TaxID=1469144 RepID=UPI00226E3EC6|nr:NAD-dependent epimerase/dehydratase family protein [Carbonactinospora thermoautotrophica]MCX9193305.1 epimerase [Carbonactinospora thermoautotrophica]